MGKQLKVFSMIILLLAVLGISACGGNKDAGKFVGSWKMTDSKGYPTTITFNSDGSWTRHVESSLNPGGQNYTGKYVIDENDKTVTVKIDPLPGDRMTYTTDVLYHYTFNGDSLTLRGTHDSDKTEEVYTRIRN